MKHVGFWRIAYRVDDPDGGIRVCLFAWEQALETAEPYSVFELRHAVRPFGLDQDYVTASLQMLEVHVVRTEPTLSPDFREAFVEVTGVWVDGRGRQHEFTGAPA